ncbi:AAA family ATPase [Sphingobacterium sp. WM]|uniref:AAA family ATPase n=1 Tax=Sphingobacterium sp. WM TaxID=3031802 RepID=UPI00240DD195|nr:AAA family ATPase [Sphingobacterium sp. WM]WFB65007.1 AAA family ATPase [Sphingobacterium sp. WM]
MTNKFNLLAIKSANQTLADAALLPDPIFLYAPLIVQGEITILFADTGIGKTALSVMIAIYIAKKYKLLYVDLELTDKQFEKRYRNDEGKHFSFPANFYRATYEILKELPEDIAYEDFFISSLRDRIQEFSAEVVIIDNMTKVVSGSTDSAKSTIPIMNALSAMKFEQGITFLVLEHNKKVDEWKPISLNDLQGSKMKSNFADSVFTIGRSAYDKNIRYIKQLKVRSGELVYDEENVLVCELTTRSGFLGLSEIGYQNERDLLKAQESSSYEDKIQEVLQLKSRGMSNVQIARQIGRSEGTIRNWLEKANN